MFRIAYRGKSPFSFEIFPNNLFDWEIRHERFFVWLGPFMGLLLSALENRLIMTILLSSPNGHLIFISNDFNILKVMLVGLFFLIFFDEFFDDLPSILEHYLSSRCFLGNSV